MNRLRKRTTGPEYESSSGISFRQPREEREKGEQKAFVQYIHIAYPRLMFKANALDGSFVSWKVARDAKSMGSGRSYPDFMFFEAVGKYHGLFIELKGRREDLWRKDGTMRKDPHLEEQLETIQRLRVRGYCAHFACGFDEARKILDAYMAGKL